jgi:hypothetical protein
MRIMKMMATRRLAVLCGLLASSGVAAAALAQSNEAESAPPIAAAPAVPSALLTPEVRADPVAAAIIAAAAAAEADPASAAPAEPAEPLPWAPPAAGAAKAPTAAHKATPYRSIMVTEKAKATYAAQWGIDKLKVSYTSSGNLIRFSYRVLDPTRARVLADKKSTPYLLGQRSHAMLKVPVMEKIGPLRQASTQEVGQEYWMVFSNKGQLVKPGDRVDVMIGAFRADGLMVE